MSENAPAALAPCSDPHGVQSASVAGLRIRPGLRVCHIGRRFVFLDLPASRYFLLEGEAAERFASFRDGTADGAAVTWLRDLHIVEYGEHVFPEPLPVPPTRSLFDAPPVRARPWLVAEALREQITAARRVRRTPLEMLLRTGMGGTIDPEACRAVAAACHAAARYRSAADQCLPNALAMRAMLARRGLAADILIGVMLPFAAHCWLQSGDMVLSDPFGRVQNFRPLMAV